MRLKPGPLKGAVNVQKKFGKKTATIIEANKIIIGAFMEEFGSTFKLSQTSMPKLVKWISWCVFLIGFFIMKPMYHTSDLSALCIALASFSFAWMIILVTQQQVIVSRQFTEKVTNAIYRIFERIRTKFADQFQDSKDADLEAVRSSVEGFMHESLTRLLDLLLPLSYWDALSCIAFSILGVIMNNLPLAWSLWNYSFATLFLALSVMMAFRVCLIIGATVFYRAISAGVDLDAYEVKEVAATAEDKPEELEDN